MKALVLEGPGRTAIQERPEPTPSSGEVLLRVRMVGMCGSDLNTFRGKNPLVSFPRIPGHEIAATVEQIRGESHNLKVGANVTISPYSNCGTCSACLRKRPNACQFNQTLGVQRDGAMTNYIVAPLARVYPAPDLSLEELCLVEPL